jgi:uncharacterized protein YxjI
VDPRWRLSQYVVKERNFSFGRQYRILDTQDRLVAYCKQKVFKLREDIRFYADEEQTVELFRLATEKIIDFNASFAVVDSATGARLGHLRRKGWKSLLKDEWLVYSPQGHQVGNLHEDSTGKAVFRRVLLFFGAIGGLIAWVFPMGYKLLLGPEGSQREGATIKERFQMYGDTYDVAIVPGAPIDARVLIGLTVLTDAVEGR